MSILNYLDLQFKQAIQSRGYIGKSISDPQQLESTSKKNIRLFEVFKISSQQIEDFSKNRYLQNSDISHLRALLEDGKSIYERYEQKTKSWSRWFLKGLARYTPLHAKQFLPRCFSNQIEKAEKETFDEYNTYKNLINQKIFKISTNQFVFENEKEDFSKLLTEGDIIEEEKSAPIRSLPSNKPKNFSLQPTPKKNEFEKDAPLSLQSTPPQEIKPPTFSECVDLTGWSIKDSDLLNWVKDGHLDQVKTLHLDNCIDLTTDILPALSKLPQLTSLTLPDLLKGKASLKNLSTFDDPFKIKMFYIASSFTRNLASQLYTGPQAWAAVFQIPLARQGGTNIFPNGQRRLDPKNMAYWLHDSDYRLLAPQSKITSILADGNTALRDGNILEFMQKFPNVSTLSLYHCLNVTEAGIIQLLNACPNIKVLDLTGCSQIKENLLLEDGNFEPLKKLNKLILDKTGINSEIIEVFKEQMGKNLSYKTLVVDPKINSQEDTKDLCIEDDKLGNLKKVDLLQIEPDQQLTSCLSYHEKKSLLSQDQSEIESLKSLSCHYIHNRISVELFCGQDEVKTLADKPFEITSDEFCDFTLSFKINDNDNVPSFDFPVQRDVLYYQSPYFFNNFREEGALNHQPVLTLLNNRVTLKAAQTVKNLLYGKTTVVDLDWKTAGVVAELVGPKLFNLSIYYKNFLQIIHSQFTFDSAIEMIILANTMDDKEGKKCYENAMCKYLKDWRLKSHSDTSEALERHEETIIKFKNISEMFELKELQQLIALTKEANEEKKKMREEFYNSYYDF